VQTHELSLGVSALLLVLAAIWLIQRFLRPGGLIRATQTRRLQLVQSIALDPRRRVTLLQCDGVALLLLTGGPSDLLLSAPVTLAPLDLGEPA
jgi:flagellar protein FliO/FliZ